MKLILGLGRSITGKKLIRQHKATGAGRERERREKGGGVGVGVVVVVNTHNERKLGECRFKQTYFVRTYQVFSSGLARSFCRKSWGLYPVLPVCVAFHSCCCAGKNK